MDIWTDTQTDGQSIKNTPKDTQTDTQTDGQSHEHTDGHTDGPMDGHTNKWTEPILMLQYRFLVFLGIETRTLGSKGPSVNCLATRSELPARKNNKK